MLTQVSKMSPHPPPPPPILPVAACESLRVVVILRKVYLCLI
jgi:hypothetical protein